MTSEESEETLALEGERQRRRQEREWFAERCGRYFIVVIIFAALLGLLGPGPLSHSIATNVDNSVRVEHYAIQRYQASSDLVVQFPRPTANQAMIQIRISRSFTDKINMESITPEPDSIKIEDDQLVYSFGVSELKQGSSVIYRYQNVTMGRITFSVQVQDSESLSLSYFICP